ncbi:hypothetical protein [Streptomyces sp. NPDC002599]|uniref:hypothetical protein n=1 Tax=Streptomyces sp. NPDC002599 TaxID=3154421 RepID=UPI00332B4338
MAVEALITEATGDPLGRSKADQGRRPVIEGTQRCPPLLEIPIVHAHPRLGLSAHPVSSGSPGLRRAGAVLAELHDEWIAFPRRYLSDESMDAIYTDTPAIPPRARLRRLAAADGNLLIETPSGAQ